MRAGVVGLRESVPGRRMTVLERIKRQGQYFICTFLLSKRPVCDSSSEADYFIKNSPEQYGGWSGTSLRIDCK